MAHLDFPNSASPERLFAGQPIGFVPRDGDSNVWHNALDLFNRVPGHQVVALLDFV